MTLTFGLSIGHGSGWLVRAVVGYLQHDASVLLIYIKLPVPAGRRHGRLWHARSNVKKMKPAGLQM
jgi:hypothetical protein